MRQISKHDVNKLSVAKLKAMLPFEVIADGEVIFVACDVNKLNPTMLTRVWHSGIKQRRSVLIGTHARVSYCGKYRN